MIRATIKITGVLVDKPRTVFLDFEETDLAIERRNEDTGKLQKLYVGELYDVFRKKSAYIKSSDDPEDHVTPELFEQWFRQKHLNGKHWYERIISIGYERL